MKRSKTLLSLSALLLALLCLFAFGAAAQSGTCGENLTWTLENETLTISGTGSMADYSHDQAPWAALTGVKTLVVEEGVTSVSERAFAAMNSLQTAAFPASLQTISKDAFWCCSALQAVTFSEGLKEIGQSAFYRCAALTQAKLPQSLQTLEKDAFSGCAALKSAELGAALKTIGSGAFFDCEALKTAKISAGIETIGDSAFQNCAALVSLELPEGLKEIGKTAFSGCAALTEVSLPQTLTTIGDSAFSGCERLRNFALPASIQTIGASSFLNCKEITSVSLPGGLTSLGVSAFSLCEKLQTATLPPSLTALPDGTFNGCKALQTATLPDSLTAIGNSAFAGCETLAAQTLPASVQTIGNYAFSGCKALSALELPSGLTAIGMGAFQGCEALASLSVPNGVSVIQPQTFFGCKTLESVSFPAGVTEIGERAFEGCERLKTITLPQGITAIEPKTFYGCGSLTAVVLPAGLTKIGTQAFYVCDKLQAIAVPQGVTEIAERTFGECAALSEITLPENLTRIGADAFSNTAYAANEANWTGELLYIQTYLITRKWADQTALTVKDGTTLIADEALSGAQKLQTLTLPASLNVIGKNALRNCGAIQTVHYGGTHTRWHALTLENENAAPLVLATIHCKTETGEALTLTAKEMPETQSTCTKAGTTGGKQCSACGVTLLAPTNKKLADHDWQIAENEGATCVKKGKIKKVCAVCETETWELNVLEPNTHEHTQTVVATPATCGRQGYTQGIYCTDCKTYISGHKTVPKLSHDWQLTVTPATLKADGMRTYVCKNCKGKAEKPIAKIASVKLSETAIVKDGKKHTPTVTVKDANGKKLKKGTAYTVTYDAGRKNFGKYNVTVVFQGNYAGKKVLQFTIGLAQAQNLKRTSVGATIASLSWSRVKYANGYVLYWAASKNGVYKHFAETTNTTYNVSNLQPKTAYYFKVKAIRRQDGKLIASGPASAPCGLRTAKQQKAASGRILIELTEENRLLAVVNKNREFPQSYQPKLKELSERGKYLDYEAADAFEAMRAAAKREGITIFAYSPYRSYSHQKASMESIIRDRQSQGYSRAKAEELALQVVLPPGTSEHNLGLAVDISSIQNTFKNTKAYAWLLKNGHKYGFILRYPEGKQDVTGITFEPWHWRYVGIDNAKKIKKSGLTLEEYTAKLKTPY